MENPSFNSESSTSTSEKTEKEDKKPSKKSAAEGLASALRPKIEQAEEKPKRLFEFMNKDKVENKPEAIEDSAETREVHSVESLDNDEIIYAGEKLFEASPVAETDLAVEPIEHFRQKFIETEGDTEAALADTNAEFGLDVEVPIGEADAETVVDDGEESVPETVETEAETEEDEPEDPAMVTMPPSSPTTPPVVPNNPNAPHIAPPAPPQGPPAPPAGPSLPPLGAPGPGFNAAPPAVNQNIAPAAVQNQNVYINNGNPAGDMLLGGIIGYFIGRRRGRIKTEKRLLPVQAKLEKQVTNLHEDLQRKESQIRQAAIKKQRKAHWDRKAGVSKVERSRATKSEAFVSIPLPSKERPVQTSLDAMPEQEAENRSNRSVAAEAARLHSVPPSTEQIGQILVGAQAETLLKRSLERREPLSQQPNLKKSTEHIEQRQAQAKEQPILKTEKHVETMNRAELMALADKVKINGSTLRQIYETHLIGERGLRRLVSEHLRGGDLNKALKREIVEREIDFERDPAMRDVAPVEAGAKPTTTASLQAMLQQAGEAHSDKDEVAFLKARADHESKQKEQQTKQRHMIDAGFVGTILILVTLVAVLVITRL